jgi:hypothetical protein
MRSRRSGRRYVLARPGGNTRGSGGGSGGVNGWQLWRRQRGAERGRGVHVWSPLLPVSNAQLAVTSEALGGRG